MSHPQTRVPTMSQSRWPGRGLGRGWSVSCTASEGAAAVADPFSGEVFFTDGTTAAWVRRDGADDALLTPTAATRLVGVNLDPPFPSAPEFRAVDLLARDEFVERFRPRVVSSTLALAWVAAGRRTAYVTDGGDLSASVHFAAGIALCRAAGRVVTGSTVARWVRRVVGSWSPPMRRRTGCRCR